MEIIKITASQNITDGESNKLISGTGRLNEEIAERPLYQQVGFTSRPKTDSRHVGIVHGNQITVIAGTDTEDDRPALDAAGDCALYTDSDTYLKIESDGTITMTNGSGNIKIESSGKITVDNLLASVEVLSTGDVNISNSLGSIKLTSTGVVDINNGGLTVDP